MHRDRDQQAHGKAVRGNRRRNRPWRCPHHSAPRAGLGIWQALLDSTLGVNPGERQVDGQRHELQVKRRKDNIPAEELRSFLAMLSGDDVGLCVTTSGSTRDAEAKTHAQHNRKITLIDRKRLVDLWIEYMGRIDEEARGLLPLLPIDCLAPAPG